MSSRATSALAFYGNSQFQLDVSQLIRKQK